MDRQYNGQKKKDILFAKYYTENNDRSTRIILKTASEFGWSGSRGSSGSLYTILKN
jgi:hypothetical protein